MLASNVARTAGTCRGLRDQIEEHSLAGSRCMHSQRPLRSYLSLNTVFDSVRPMSLGAPGWMLQRHWNHVVT